MTRRLAALAAVVGTGATLFAHGSTASACDPNRPPYCITACTVTRDLYRSAYYATGGGAGPLPSWYELALMDCGS